MADALGLKRRSRGEPSRSSKPQEALKVPGRPDPTAAILLSVVSLAVSIVALALVARMPDHHSETTTRLETTRVVTEETATSSAPPRELYGVHLIPSGVHVYSHDGSNQENSNVAAVVHGDLLVVGNVIELSPETETSTPAAPAPAQESSWGAQVGHRDKHSSQGSGTGTGTCAQNLLKPGLVSYIRCTSCNKQKFNSKRAECCFNPQACVIPQQDFECHRRFDEATCVNAGCMWDPDNPVQVNSGFEAYTTKCKVNNDPSLETWMTYTVPEPPEDASSIGVYRERQIKLYDQHGSAGARAMMDRPSYFLEINLDLPQFQYRIFSESGKPLGASEPDAANANLKNLDKDTVPAAGFYISVVDDAIDVSSQDPAMKATIKYAQSPANFDMHVNSQYNRAEYSSQPTQLELKNPAMGRLPGTAKWEDSNDKVWRVAPASVARLVNLEETTVPTECTKKVNHIVACFETKNHALCAAELASNAYQECCYLLYENNIHISC